MDALKDMLFRLQKSPAMYLQEICTKQGCNYQTGEKDLKANPSSDPRFEVTLSVANFDRKNYQGVGVARSKKDAKQLAAMDLLSQMLTLKDIMECGASVKTKEPVAPLSNPSPITTTTDMEISSTVCQDIIDLCAKKGLPNPEYLELGVEGPPHLRVFTYECRVRFPDDREDLVVVVEAGQKQKAKRLAATKLMLKVKGEVSVTGPTSADDLSSANQASVGGAENLCDNRAKCHELFAHDHHRFHSFQGNAIRQLHQNYGNFEDSTNYTEILQQVATEEEFKVDYDVLPGLNYGSNIQSICQMTFTFNRYSPPPAVVFGSGPTEENSLNNSAFQALYFLKEVTKVSAPVG